MARYSGRIVSWEKGSTGKEWRAVCEDGSDLYLDEKDVEGINQASGWRLPSVSLLIETDRLGNVENWTVESSVNAEPDSPDPGPLSAIPDEVVADDATPASRSRLPGVVIYLIYVAIGVVAGQIAALIIARILGRVVQVGDALLGERTISDPSTIIGSAAYAFVICVAVAWGLGAFNRRAFADPESIQEAEGLGGLTGGSLAFLLVTLLAEPYREFLFAVVPGAAGVLTDSSPLIRVVAILALHAAAIAVVAFAAYLPIRAAYNSQKPYQRPGFD